MATGAEIIEPAAPSMEHASGILDQIVTEFSVAELKKPHVEMHQPLQAMESTEELAITNGCKAEESVWVEYQGNGRALEGESFSESHPSAKVAAEQNEAGEARYEETDEKPMHEKQPLGAVTVGDEHGHRTDEAELEPIKEEKAFLVTSTEEFTPIIEKEVSTLEKSAAEIESEKFDVEYIERDLGEMKDAKPNEAGPECKSEDTNVVSSGLSLVNRSEVGLHPEEASDSISVSTAVIDSVVVGEDEQGLTGQSKSVTENPEDCVPVAAEATVISEEEIPSLSQEDGFRQEEARVEQDELDPSLVQEEETITSQPVKMETEELHEVSSYKPEEQVTAKDEAPLLTETPTGDAYEASKSVEIPVHPPTEEKIPVVEEAGQLQCEAGDTEIPKDQVDEASSTTETIAEDETKAIKDAEDAIDEDHSLEQGMPLTEGEKSADVVIEEDASVLKETQAEDESKAEEKNPLLVDEAEPLDNGVSDTEAGKLDEIPSTGCTEEITEENEAPVSREAQAEDIFEASESKEIAVPEQPSTDKEDLPLDQEDVETEELKTGSADMEVEKLDEISDFGSKEEGNVELEPPLAREIQAEEDSETNASEASAGPVTGTDATDCLKEAEEEQPGVEIGHDTEAPSASLEDCHSAEEVAPAAGEKEAEITELKEDIGDEVSFKAEATETSVALVEEHEVASLSENAEPESSKDTSEEANDEPLKCDPGNSVAVPLVGEGDIKEVKSGDEEPNTNDSTSEEATPIVDEVGTEVKEPEIENHTRSIDTPLEEIDTKEYDTSNSDKVEVDKHEEVTCDELSTEIPENSPMLPPEEIIEAHEEVAEAPEDDRKIDETPLQGEEKLKNENEQTEGGEDICATAEKQSEEKIHNSEDEILTTNESDDVTDQDKVDEPKVSDESSPNQNMQAEEIEEAEPLPVSSLLEKAILEQSMASSENPVEELGEDHEPVNIEADLKPDAPIIEEVIDSADTGKETSYVSAPSSEDHSYEAISGTEHDTHQEPNESPTLGDADKIMDRECTPNEISETAPHETANETTDAAEVIEEHDEPEKAIEDETEVKVKGDNDIDLESSLDSEVGAEKCVEEEQVQTTLEVVETQEANLQSHEETIAAETREKHSETTREVVPETQATDISTEVEEPDKQTTSEEVCTNLEPEKQCEKTAEENDSTEEKFTSEEEVRDAEILTKDASVDVTDEGKVDEPKETDESSANQNIQMDDGGCEKPGDGALNNAEPLPASSQTEEIILEEKVASENLPTNSKAGADVVEEHREPEKATEEEKEVMVQRDIILESSPNSEVGEEKCVEEEEEVRTVREVVETQEANLRSHEETIEAETQEKDSETTLEAVQESKAPEISIESEEADKQTSSDEVTTGLEPEKQCENDSTEEKVTNEEVREADILTRSASLDVTDQGEVDEPKETVENSANQDVQMDDGGCEKPGDEALNNAEPLPASSEIEKIVLEESTASDNPDGELVKDDKPDNVQIDSKPGANIIEEVNESADAEISCASEPALEDQSDEVLLPEAKEGTFQKPDQGLSADDVNEFGDQVCIPAVVGGVEVKETVESVSETERHESVDGTRDAVELTEERDDIEKADDNDKEVKVQDDVNTESVLVTEGREEKCLEAEDVPISGAPEPEVEVSDSVALTAPVEDEEDDQCNKETGKPETEVIDTETAREVAPGTGVTELPAVFEDTDKQTSFEEATASSEPEKQSEEATGVYDPTEEKASNEEVDGEKGKAGESENLEEQVMDDVSDSKEIYAPSPVEYTAAEEADSGPVPEGTEAELENVHPEEIIAGGSECETTTEGLEQKKVQEGGSDSILETEDATEEAASNLTSEHCIPEEEISKKEEEAVQDPNDEREGSTAAAEEACGSKHPETEAEDALDGASEEEKSELTGITGETDGVSREMDVTDSQCTESVFVEETISDRSRELETEVSAPIPNVILGEKETAAVIEEIAEENEKVAKFQENEAGNELPCAAEVTEFEEQQRTVDGDSEANEADTKEATKVEDFGQEPLKEETETAHIDALIGEESIATVDATGLSLEKTETTQEPSPGIQVEETIVSEDSESPNVNVVEATMDADKPCESIVETSNDKEHHEVGDVDGSESVEQVIEKDDVPEERDFSTVSTPTDYDEGAVKVELPGEENEEVMADVNELSTKEERAILEAQDPDNENEGSKVVAEEACGSKLPETEVVDAVNGTFEEEKSETTAITGETDGISREMDVSDSQCTESVSVEETISDRSGELETQVFAAIPDVIPEIGENENAAMDEKTTEDDKTDFEVQKNEDLDLASAGEVAKSEEQQQTVDGDSEANADTKGDTKEEAPIDALIGEEVVETTNATYLSLEKAATTQEPSPGTQTEETVVAEISQTPIVNVVEATIDANKQCENIVETSNDEEQYGVGDIDGSESVKQVIEKDCVPEERDFGIGSADYDEVADKVERSSEEIEEVLTETKEFPSAEEQAIPEARDEQTVVPIEQPGTVVGVTEEESVTDAPVQESESLQLSSASEAAKDECIEKDKQIADVASAADESSETRSLIFREETVEASKEYENSIGADGIIQDDIPNEKDDIGNVIAREGESSEDAKPSCEISSESLAVGEEGDSDIIPGEDISETEASASSVTAADADIVSAAVADDVEEQVEKKVSEVAETPYEESNDAATLTTEATVVKSREVEQDELVKESDRDILTDNALETDRIERDGSLVEEAHGPHVEDEESTSIKEEVVEKASITEEIHVAYEERDSISVPAEDIGAKDLDEQIQVGNIEPEANATSAGDLPITDVLESGATVDEQVSTSVEEIKEVEEVEKEIPEEAEDLCEKTDREVPEISLSEAEQDQKPVEKTAETETGHGGEEPEEVLTAVCPVTEEVGGTVKDSGPANGSIGHAEATAVVEEVTVKNTDVGGSELETGGVAEKISVETPEFASVPEEMEETVKEVELRHVENLQSAPAPEAPAEEVFLVKAEEISTEATESASVTETIEVTTKEVELLQDENPRSAPVPEAVEEICLEKAEEISTEAAESASVAEEIEQTTKEVVLRHDENLQSAPVPVPAEEVCSGKAEEVIAKTAESATVIEEIGETTKAVDLRQSTPAPESEEEACLEKLEEVTTSTTEAVSDIDGTAEEVELRHDLNVVSGSAFTPEATEEVYSEKTEEISTRAPECVSVTEEIEETTKELELRHEENLQSAPAPEPAKEVCSENAEEMSTTAAEYQSDIETHKVSHQLEEAEIIEKHFEVATANSVAEEPTEKIADEVSPGITSEQEPIYPFVEEQESRQAHPVVDETPEEIRQENRLKDEEVIEEKTEILASTVNELRDQEEKIFKVEDKPAHNKVGDINGEIVKEEQVSTVISEGEDPSARSLYKTMETVILTGKDDGATIEKPEESILGPETPYLPEHGEAEAECTPGGKALEEPADAADVPLSDLLKKPATETLQETTRGVESSSAVTNKAEEAKTGEERDEHEADEDEHSPEDDTPVMVESSKDADVKTPQKKSHNILSGVGSKVKHSISKVKKAITGKSSHSKTASPPKQSS